MVLGAFGIILLVRYKCSNLKWLSVHSIARRHYTKIPQSPKDTHATHALASYTWEAVLK